jgi:hypothetical protein
MRGDSWTVDAANHLTAVQIGGGMQATIASATITDLWSTASSSVSVTGTTTVTQLANGDAVPGTLKVVTFTGITTLTQGAGGAPLNLPNNGANITTAAGDYAVVLALSTTNTQVVLYQRATGAALSSVGLSIGASGLASSVIGYESPINMQVNASVASGQLTVAIKGVNGSDPSSSNPVLVGFRSQTQNSGINVFGSLQAATLFTLASTSSLGCVTGVLCRLWGELICQTESAGACTSILVGLSVQSQGAGTAACFPLLEHVLQSTGSGTSGGTSVNTIYTSVSALSGKAIRIAFFVEATWTSGAGWALASNNIVQLLGPGVKKPCDIVQSTFQNAGATFSITPTSAANLIRIAASTSFQGSATNTMGTFTISLTEKIGAGSTLGILTQTLRAYVLSADFAISPSTFNSLRAPGTTGNVTYGFSTTGASAGLNGNQFFLLEEIMGGLEPANDNAESLSLVG